MSYAILRFQKKKMGGVSACYAHNERKKEFYKSNPEINLYKTAENIHYVLPKQTYLREVKRMIAGAGCKVRSNSTVMVETLITASPDFFKEHGDNDMLEFFDRSLSFMKEKVGTENIIAAVVHMDEKTPHMHLVFCPIIENSKKPGEKSLSAKAILGNRTNLSNWQTAFHAYMSERFPELERGISAQITKRKHIPVWLFKSAERLDKQFAELSDNLEGINWHNASKKRDEVVKTFERIMPSVAKFTATVKQYDGYIKELEQAEKETQERIEKAESKSDERVRSVQGSMQKVVDSKDEELAEKDREILEAQREAREAAANLRRQAYQFEGVIGRMPLEMRDKFFEIEKKMAEQAKLKKDRGRAR